MISLNEYVMLYEDSLNRSKTNLSSNDWNKHNYKYLKFILNKLINKDGILYLGNDNSKNKIDFDCSIIDDETIKKLEHFNIDNANITDFNEILKKYNITWTSINKKQITGIDGTVGNKGNEFEHEFYNNYEIYQDRIKEIIPYKKLINVTHDGSKNSSRPITFINNNIYAGGNNFNIGKTITDITVHTQDKGDIYLSLKATSTNTFWNGGLKKYFDMNFFTRNNILSNEGKSLLKLFDIDEDTFKQVFNMYRKQHDKFKRDDITSHIDNNIFYDFVRSIIGYGYILVHEIKPGNIEYINLTSKNNLESLISKVKSATIYYGGIQGNGKRVDIIVEMDKIHLKFNIRSKDGSKFPTHIMVDYKIIK